LQHYSKSSQLAPARDPYLDALVLGEPSFGKGTVQFKVGLSTWPGETFTDEERKNGVLDGNERFTDVNGNGLHDEGEPFEDRTRKNERWDDAERWDDTNGNGTRDEGETFTDENGDGMWNPAESFADADKDGRYDYGAAMRLTVAHYYLPSGRHFTRERVLRDGEYIYEGGVVPDIAVQPAPLKASHLGEFQEIQQTGALRDYVQSRWANHRDLFHRLAFDDGRDPSRYPDFDAVYDAHHACLTRQEFRRALRIEVRRQVANDLGTEIRGDLSDDPVLRRGVIEVLRRLGTDPASLPEIRDVVARENDEK
ncbi:MAG: hypothetical protein ACREID_05480, partial [Planctomycetota bacterium]